MDVRDGFIGTIGRTPLIRLRRASEETGCVAACPEPFEQNQREDPLTESPLDDLATRLRPGVELSSICAGGGGETERLCLDVLAPGLDAGLHWVVIASLEDSGFLAGVERLNRYAAENAEPTLLVLTSDSPEVQGRFAFTQGAPATFKSSDHFRVFLKKLTVLER